MKKVFKFLFALSPLLVCEAKVSSKVRISLSEIQAIKKSSKKGYESKYLFVGRVIELSEIDSNGHVSRILEKDSFIEVMADKSVCFEEVKMALMMKPPFKLTLINLRKVFYKKVKGKKEYTAFVKIEPIIDDQNINAGCVLSKVNSTELM